MTTDDRESELYDEKLSKKSAVRFAERRTSLSKDDYGTPSDEISLAKCIFGGYIYLDPCASVESSEHFAIINYPPKTDGLLHRWFDKAYLNPPYKELRRWTEKGRTEVGVGNCREQLWLVPGRALDTRWWKCLMEFCQLVAFKDRRIKFVGAKYGAMFPSALCYCGPNEDRFKIEVITAGWIVYKKE